MAITTTREDQVETLAPRQEIERLVKERLGVATVMWDPPCPTRRSWEPPPGEEWWTRRYYAKSGHDDRLAAIEKIAHVVPSLGDLREALNRLKAYALGGWIEDATLFLIGWPTVRRDHEGRVHCADGPAVTGPYGSIYAWHGYEASEALIMNPPAITAYEFRAVPDAVLDRVGGFPGLVGIGVPWITEQNRDRHGSLYRLAGGQLARFVVSHDASFSSWVPKRCRSVSPKRIMGQLLARRLTGSSLPTFTEAKG